MPRRHRPVVRNPPWLTQVIAEHYTLLEEKVPPQWLPRLADVHAASGKLEADVKEYGCGVYGCVVPTLESDVVLKATTDETEAMFAYEKAHLLVAPVVCKYLMVISLSVSHQGRRVYLLWREAADDVGKAGKRIDEFVDLQVDLAKIAFEAAYTGKPQKVVKAAVGAWLAYLDKHADEPDIGHLFKGMAKVAREQRVLFGDVHSGNIGLVRGKWLVVDPGNIAELGANEV